MSSSLNRYSLPSFKSSFANPTPSNKHTNTNLCPKHTTVLTTTTQTMAQQTLLCAFLLLGSLCVGSLADSKSAPRKVVFGKPEQVHISFGVGYPEMWITWMSFFDTHLFPANATVEYGLKSHLLDQVTLGSSTYFLNGNRTSFVHRVLLENLQPSTHYYYRCGTAEFGWSAVYTFQTRPENQETWSPRVLVFGDLGLENGRSIPFIKAQVANKSYDAIFHVGDFAYDLDKNNGETGDEFMREMESATATVAYQTVVGNHEAYHNFTHYTNRFTMVDERTRERNNHFYSFNIGPAHVIAFSSEFYYWYTYSEQPVYTLTNTRIQFEWLEADLREASKPENRQKRPWIIAMGHRPMYCSTVDDDCTSYESILRSGIPIVKEYGLEDLFYKYGVDIVFGAHAHTYERLLPVYNHKVYNGSDPTNPYKNCKAPIHMVVGAAGCNELPDPFLTHPPEWSAKRIRDYGVMELTLHNGTHISMVQQSTDKLTGIGKVVDEALFIKELHGPEAWL